MCNYCKLPGHIKSDCEAMHDEQTRREMGEYADKIVEGGRSMGISLHGDNDSNSDVNMSVTSGKALLLRASNCKRLGNFSPNVINTSVSGASFEKLMTCLIMWSLLWKIQQLIILLCVLEPMTSCVTEVNQTR